MPGVTGNHLPSPAKAPPLPCCHLLCFHPHTAVQSTAGYAGKGGFWGPAAHFSLATCTSPPGEPDHTHSRMRHCSTPSQNSLLMAANYLPSSPSVLPQPLLHPCTSLLPSQRSRAVSSTLPHASRRSSIGLLLPNLNWIYWRSVRYDKQKG